MDSAFRETEPKSWGELITELTYVKPGGDRLSYSYIFRGVSDSEHKLVPSLGRTEIYKNSSEADRQVLEARTFEEFRYRFAAEMPGDRYDFWELLAVAQHVGVPTRLLDWSTSPLVGLFFALSSQTDRDRAVYCLTFSKHNNNNEVSKEERLKDSPFAATRVRRFSPPLAFPRLRNQRGVFTIQPNPTIELPLKHGKKIIINKSYVDGFRRILFQYGIDFAYIYPDEEGIGQQLKWHLNSVTGLGVSPKFKSLPKK
jgi:hypothetical protein